MGRHRHQKFTDKTLWGRKREIYPQTFEEKVGFDKIRTMLRDGCISELGEERVDQMSFGTKHKFIKEALYRVQEFMQLAQSDEYEFPTQNYYDLRATLGKTKAEGTFIELEELLKLYKTLATAEEIERLFKKEEVQKRFFLLSELASKITSQNQILKSISKIMDKDGVIKDNASPKLAEIRMELSRTTARISKTMNSIVRSAREEGILDQDVNPSIRDGRLVIPVNPAFKRKIKGIVHDESATGKTIFIEPAEIVEANNKIRELENEERREIVKILISITNEIRPEAYNITQSLNILGEFDFIRSKARLATRINATVPEIVEGPLMEWYHAIHPLLFLTLEKQGKKVVPLEIKLNNHQRILLISGPNAGGKSVCLKTVGLLQYMFQCGVPIPMESYSKAGIFNQLYIDIGDEQSIEDDLSTYSSHLKHMKKFAQDSDAETLILIDEFGGGTEPQIGGAIAEALLNRFHKNETYGVITTHYQNLKHFASEHEGIVNAAMLYDRHMMQPLFQLSIGSPGSSFAIEIAKKIGLPEEVMQEATNKVGADYVNMDRYLLEITRDKKYWEQKRDSIRKREKQLERTIEQYEKELSEIKRKQKEIIQDAKQEATHLISSANAQLEATIREIRESEAERERTLEARRKFKEFEQRISLVQEDDTRIDKKLNHIRSVSKKKKRKTDNESPMKEIKVGDLVTLKGQKTVGEVLAISEKEATVAFGMIKSKLNPGLLIRTNKKEKPTALNEKNTYISANTVEGIHQTQINFKQDIDIRGMRADEALQAITYFIDDAILVGATRVRILHGTGTGALREVTRDYLSAIQEVKSYRDEHVQFGGAGITVVEFKK